MTSGDPEVGRSRPTGDLLTNYHDTGDDPGGSGSGSPVLLLHGSGPGVSAWANWRLALAALTPHRRVIAPDLAGFGHSRPPAAAGGIRYHRESWVRQVVQLLDALDIRRASVVGNSFGGSIALGLAIAHPDRVDRLVLMGSTGVPFPITEGLDAVWGYRPSVEAMGRLMRETFAHDPGLVTDDLVRMRYRASVRPGAQEAFASMFPAPRQRWVDALAHDEAAVRVLPQPTLLVHGRDDRVVPLRTTLTLLDWIPDSRAHVFGNCGHWVQIERAREFHQLLIAFLE